MIVSTFKIQVLKINRRKDVIMKNLFIWLKKKNLNKTKGPVVGSRFPLQVDFYPNRSEKFPEAL